MCLFQPTDLKFTEMLSEVYAIRQTGRLSLMLSQKVTNCHDSSQQKSSICQQVARHESPAGHDKVPEVLTPVM